ncbi:hypothetical protein Tco_1503987 [Tanacetum coccineum]
MNVANFRTLIALACNEADVAVSVESVQEVKERFETSVYYGFILGRTVAYPVVENYVKNTWSRFGLVRTMMNSRCIFFFKFNSNTGRLEECTGLVKLHDVPIMALTEDGLSVIAIILGTPLMLDTYTTSMCTESWGQYSFARAMIDLHAMLS